MREIEFRGKGCQGGGWFYGKLWDKDIPALVRGYAFRRGCLDIDPKTVGQYTGLCDENGNKIFEGDILEVESMEIDTLGQKLRCKVIFSESHAAFMVDKGSEESVLFPLWRALIENNAVVIGNIHDNPQLLKS